MSNLFTLSRAAQQRASTVSHRLKNAKNLRERGFMSIELGLVLLVVAIMIAAAVLFYRDTQRKNAINNNVADVVSISGNLVAKYGQLNRYGDVTTELAVKANVIPAHLRDVGADTASNRFGGVIALAPADITATNDAVAITWPNVPSAMCSDIVSGVQGEFRVITVDGTEVKADGDILDMTALEDACDTGAATELVFSVGRT
jgi:hypothetical protein